MHLLEEARGQTVSHGQSRAGAWILASDRRSAHSHGKVFSGEASIGR